MFVHKKHVSNFKTVFTMIASASVYRNLRNIFIDPGPIFADAVSPLPNFYFYRKNHHHFHESFFI